MNVIGMRRNKEVSSINVFSLTLFLFASSCFWEESKLSLFLASGVIIAFIALVTMVTKHISVNTVVSCKAIQWLILNYLLIDIYGMFFLRTGSFNLDFITFNGVLLVCICIICLRAKDTEQIIKEYLLACTISTILIVIYMYINGVINYDSIDFGFRFGSGLSGNSNTIATSFSFMFLPTLYSIVVKKYRNIFGIIACVLSLSVMLLTGSKKSLLIIAVAVIMVFYIYRTPMKYIILPMVVLVGIYSIFNVPILYNVIGYRVVDMLATFGIGKAVTAAQSTASRSEYIILGLKSFFNHPVLGGGMNYFQYINQTVHYSHNNYIELLNNLGVIGVLVHYVPSIKALCYFKRYIKNNNEDKQTVYMLCIAMIIAKYLLDIGMVSFSALGAFYLPFVIPFMVMRKERQIKCRGNN